LFWINQIFRNRNLEQSFFAESVYTYGKQYKFLGICLFNFFIVVLKLHVTSPVAGKFTRNSLRTQKLFAENGKIYAVLGSLLCSKQQRREKAKIK
jgi:hypothetical protein